MTNFPFNLDKMETQVGLWNIHWFYLFEKTLRKISNFKQYKGSEFVFFNGMQNFKKAGIKNMERKIKRNQREQITLLNWVFQIK